MNYIKFTYYIYNHHKKRGDIMKGYSQLNYRKRIHLETMFSLKLSKFEIAAKMNICLKTVYNEWNKGRYLHTNSDLTTEWRYSADKAQSITDKNVSNRGTMPKLLKDRKLAREIENNICNNGYSVEVTVNVMKQSGRMYKYEQSVCTSTVYNAIDKGYFTHITNKDLPIRRNKKRHKKKAVRVQKRDIAGTSIEDRPEDILTREEFGHWEMDSVIGARGKSKNTLLTIFERKTRQPIIYKQSDKSSASVVAALDAREKKMGDKFYAVFKSITVDNGTEFADCEGIERSCIYPGKKRTQVYYCHPYCSSERGSNENGNRMIRRKIPKGTNFDNMSKKEIAQVQKWLENYPRRMFSYKSSKQLYMEEMKLLI